ncbi:alpha/beta fold hydrolase [Rubrobacter marinus]|uniref:Alpha/beta fold hydrolase n=1 Tax=Rubrobacter marinus TaxID=2653852 RepID=A0A6G8PZ62_9ACTN|nr:alpha/beta hydrolase [Rubrobacter marinus]QIN79460.1 alpha/beta fold hydrolase [Rubrobacter marinus]
MNPESGYADLGDVRLHYVEAGEGPLVVLLHGFPQTHRMWRFQIPALVEDGLRVVAPDMRGYNLSEKPKGVEHYGVDGLARDVERLIAERGEQSAAVVGHDWGGIVAWFAAMRYPERVRRLGILNVPHPSRFMDGLTMPEQLLRSLYVFFFQLPRLPEKTLGAGDFAVLRAGFRRDPVRPGAISEEDVEHYAEAMARPGALTATINYYRALLRSPRRAQVGLKKIAAPTLVIWGERDRFLSSKLAEPGPLWVPNLRVERLPDASHWVAEDRPERVNELLLDFLREP